jgi:hypothetical protein
LGAGGITDALKFGAIRGSSCETVGAGAITLFSETPLRV